MIYMRKNRVADLRVYYRDSDFTRDVIKYSKKQMKIARVAEPRDRITGADFRKLRQGKRKRNG